MNAELHSGSPDITSENDALKERESFSVDFLDYIERSFLGEMYEDVSRARDVAGVVGTVVSAVSDIASKDKTIYGDINVISSVAKNMVHEHIYGEAPSRYWGTFREVEAMKQLLVAAEHEDLEAFGKSFNDTPVDIDIKLVKDEKTPISELAVDLARHLRIPDDQISRSEVEAKNGDIKGTRVEYTIDLDGYRLRVAAGPSPTSKIDLLKVFILDQASQEQLLHMDIAGYVRTDKRAIRSSTLQDEVRGVVHTDNGRVEARFSPDAQYTYLSRDSLRPADFDEIGDMAEIAFRALRHNLFQDRKHLPIENRSDVIDLPRFDMQFPLFTSGTAFHIQDMISDRILDGEALLPYEKEKMMQLLMRELAINLVINPYDTVHALFDTGLDQILNLPKSIRGERTTMMRILQSDHLSTARLTGARERPADLRGYTYIAEQRNIYLYGDEETNIAPQYDGFYRVMRALGAEEGREWSYYLKLWEEPLGLKDITFGDEAKVHLGETSEHAKIGPYILIATDGRTLDSSRDVRDIARVLYSAASILPPKDARILMAISLLKDVYNVDSLFDNGHYQTAEESIPKDDMIEAMAVLYDIMHHCDTSFTPQQLQRLYYDQLEDEAIALGIEKEHESVLVKRRRYSQVFLLLKQVGVFARVKMKRISDGERGGVDEVRETSSYVLLPIAERHNISSYLHRPDFKTLVERVMVDRELPFQETDVHYRIPEILKEQLDLLNTAGITTVEALESLSLSPRNPVDLDLIAQRWESNDPQFRANVERACRILRTAFRMHFLHEHRSDLNLPDVYRLNRFYESEDGIDMQEIYPGFLQRWEALMH